MSQINEITIKGACENNLRNLNVTIPRKSLSVITGVSGSGKSSLAFDTLLSEAQRKYFFTLSHYSRQFLSLQQRAKVSQISGLSPPISLPQVETSPSPRATIATYTDLGELLGIAFSRCAKFFCPKHDLETTIQTPSSIVDQLTSQHSEKLVAITAPLIHMKQIDLPKYARKLEQRGYLRLVIDDQIVQLPLKEESKQVKTKHSVKALVDLIIIPKSPTKRLLSSVNTALSDGDGHVEIIPVESDKKTLKTNDSLEFSTTGGCPVCGFSWPKLDSRYFNANSLGQCTTCLGKGEVESSDTSSNFTSHCESCFGSGIHPKMKSITLGKKYTIYDFYLSPIDQLPNILRDISKFFCDTSTVWQRILPEIHQAINSILDLGLGYLHPARKLRSLSGGEHQRLRIAVILKSCLSGVLYILDEPSQGLHPSEVHFLLKALQGLIANKNTVIVVDHDEIILRRNH